MHMILGESKITCMKNKQETCLTISNCKCLEGYVSGGEARLYLNYFFEVPWYHWGISGQGLKEGRGAETTEEHCLLFAAGLTLSYLSF